MDESFVILPKLLQSVHASAYITNTTEQIQIQEQLLQIVSQESQVDQPVCQDCVSRILNELEEQYKDAVQQKEQYRESLQQLEQRELVLVEDQQFEQQITEFERAEADLLLELSGLQEEHEWLQEELDKVRKSTEEVEEEEYRYWRQFNEYKLQYDQFVDERDSLTRRIELTQTKLQELQNTDIFDECFHIVLASPDNCFGSISGFRLGTSSQIKVPWHEINAAWGQAALLLHTLAKQCSFQFSRYEIVPKGSYSYMLRRSDNYQYELHAQGNRFSLVANRRYDKAMQFFLSNLNEMCTWWHSRNPRFQPPLRMEEAAVGGKSIKFQFNSDDAWTEGMAALLVNLRHLAQALTNPNM